MFSLCCICNANVQRGFKFQTLTYANYSKLDRAKGLLRLGDIILNNVQVTEQNIRHCHAMGWAYRISSALFPLLTYDKAGISFSDLPNAAQIQAVMDRIAAFVRLNNFHLSSHPDQFVCLGSASPDVRAKSIAELDFHGWVLNQFGAPQDYNCPINIHINGYGDLQEVTKRFEDSYYKLSVPAKSRLVVENEDKPNSWSVNELYHHFYPVLGIPLTFDTLHHKLNAKGLYVLDAFVNCLSTWGDYRPHFHYSESDPTNSNPRAHAMMPAGIPMLFGHAQSIVWDVELKGKDDAIQALEKLVVHQ